MIQLAHSTLSRNEVPRRNPSGYIRGLTHHFKNPSIKKAFLGYIVEIVLPAVTQVVT